MLQITKHLQCGDLFQITPVTSLIITNIIKCGGDRSGDEIEDHSRHLLHPQKVEEDLVVEKSKINLYHCVHLSQHHSCHHSHHKFPQMPHQRWRRTWWWRSPRSNKSPTTSTLSLMSSCDRTKEIISYSKRVNYCTRAIFSPHKT